jgi:TolB-like protein/DNA-binding winged helix-turn-helix (wHTH) protein/Flp pilus assembly protein TadD
VRLLLLQASYSFGEFELDPPRFELRRHGRAVKLERIPLELLILLAEKDGSVVSRQEIVERIWGKDVFVDSEHGINTAIRKIRAALHEDADRPRFVQTVPGKGYRFGAGLKYGNGSATAPAAVASAAPLQPFPASPPAAEVPPRKRFGGRALMISALVTLLLTVVALGFNIAGLRDRIFVRNRVGPIHSIAVLPLANLSGDASQDYFADGMTEELITALAKNHAWRVVSRTSAMHYKGVNRPVRDIARELGVDGILEGSVVRSQKHVHMTLQLIYAPTDAHVWAESYDRDLVDALSLPQELSQTIAGAARVASAPVKEQRSISAEAHDAYLQGRYVWYAEGAYESRGYFEKAIQLQPDYAAAWAGLADSYTASAVERTCPAREIMAQAKAAARKAVELDDSLPEAHNSMAAVSFFLDWDWERADAESLRAIELNPNHAEARHLHSYVLAAMNRTDEALAEQKRSSEMEPFARPGALGTAYLRARQYDAAVKELRLSAEARPEDGYVRLLLAQAYHFKGMSKESVGEWEEVIRLTSGEEALAKARPAFEQGGEEAVFKWNLNSMEASARKEYVSPAEFAQLYGFLGWREETLKYLDEAYREHSPRLVFLQNEPCYDFLHSDPRYRALVRKIGLPPAY